MSGTSARAGHRAQPVVKSVLVYRNGDPFFAGRRVVIHEKKMSTFDVFLKEVTGGVQAPFGAVRNLYTPRTGHRIRKLDQIQSGGNYVAGGQEAFKKLNYLDIGEIKKRPMEVVNTEVKPVIHSRINVSARFRKPLQEPCTIFLIANGDLISPAARLLIPRKALNQWDHVLQMVTEKITLRSGAVHRLYTLEGKLVENGAELENGQFYVAVGRDKFKKLPYSELLFDKSTMRRSYGQKASSLPPIVGSKKSKGSGNDRQSKSTVGSSDNSSPQPPKRRGKKADVNLEKPTKGKQNVKLKNSRTIPNSERTRALSVHPLQGGSLGLDHKSMSLYTKAATALHGAIEDHLADSDTCQDKACPPPRRAQGVSPTRKGVLRGLDRQNLIVYFLQGLLYLLLVVRDVTTAFNVQEGIVHSLAEESGVVVALPLQEGFNSVAASVPLQIAPVPVLEVLPEVPAP
ncbi:PREDICTED: doublecortin domain-containing protein 2 [Hipposideros armiger]|uniref:Doublecortin domain-containing protein 2 n=1 Tax=Hipposideros armiger TaxID=186990 RepID=A0A8B7R4V8_HIPAR|nr:PREDICTED: doublecortin domain-containing protein 2 [Hipposideros armiger]